MRRQQVNSAQVGFSTVFPGGSLSSRIVHLALRGTVKPVVRLWSWTPALPWPYFAVDHLGRALRIRPGTTHERVALPRCTATVVRPTTAARRTIVHLQGGAFLVGGRHLHRQLAAEIAHRTASTIVLPEYRKLPRHPLHASVQDGLDAYRHALALGTPPEQIVLLGDSAGGLLAVLVALGAAHEGLPTPAAIVLLSPLVDLDPGHRESIGHRPRCALFTRRAARCFHRVAERAARRSGTPLTAPADLDLAGLPPTLIQASTTELILPDAVHLAELLDDAGVAVELQLWENQVHVFQAAAAVSREAREALDQLASFVDHAVPARGRHLTSVS